MKTVSPALAALLNSGVFCSGIDVFDPSNVFVDPDVFNTEAQQVPVFVPFDLYTITTPIGLRLTYTTAPFAVAAPDPSIWDAPAAFGAGNLWQLGMAWQPFPIDIRESRATAHWKMGLDADTWTVTVVPRRSALGADGQVPTDPAGGDVFDESNPFVMPDVFTLADMAAGPDFIGSEPWLAAAAVGALDEADCIVSRAYFATMPTYPLPPAGAVPVGTIILFRGTVGEVDIGAMSAVLTLNDYRRALTQQLPRNTYQAECRHRFGDARCGVNLSAYTVAGTVGSGTIPGVIVSSGDLIPPALPGGGSGTFALGTLTMTSGRNVGFRRLVSLWGGRAFSLLNPFPYAVAPGDTFAVSTGCDKRLVTCEAYQNRPNFGGEPFIPAPETSLL